MQPDPYMHIKLLDEELARMLSNRALVREADAARRSASPHRRAGGRQQPGHGGLREHLASWGRHLRPPRAPTPHAGPA